MDLTHNPEFTTIELYEAYGDLSSMMRITEGMIRHAAEKVTGKTEFLNIFNPEGEKIDISKPFRKTLPRPKRTSRQKRRRSPTRKSFCASA